MRCLSSALLLLSVVSLLNSCSPDDDGMDVEVQRPTVSFIVSGTVTDAVSYSNSEDHVMLGEQVGSTLNLVGYGPHYSFHVSVPMDSMANGTYDATIARYVNNADTPVYVFNVLMDGGVVIDSVALGDTIDTYTYLCNGSFSASVTNAANIDSVAISGTFSNVSVTK